MDERKKPFFAIGGYEDADDDDTNFQEIKAIVEAVTSSVGLDENEVRVGGFMGGHGASFGTVAVYAIASWLVYKEIIDGAEKLEKGPEFVRKLTRLWTAMTIKMREIRGDNHGVSMSDELAITLALAHAMRQYDTLDIQVVGTRCFPDITDPSLRGMPATYQYNYIIELVVEGCHEFCFVNGVIGVMTSTHVSDGWGRCEHFANQPIVMVTPTA